MNELKILTIREWLDMPKLDNWESEHYLITTYDYGMDNIATQYTINWYGGMVSVALFDKEGRQQSIRVGKCDKDKFYDFASNYVKETKNGIAHKIERVSDVEGKKIKVKHNVL